MTLHEVLPILQGIADGKEWQYRASNGKWNTPSKDTDPLFMCCGNLCIRLKPWQLPAPPAGKEWHRTDWTEEMLPDGWRPLLLRECRQFGDEYFCQSAGGNYWTLVRDSFYEVQAAYPHYRTRRPTPSDPPVDPYTELKAAHKAGKTIQYKSSRPYAKWMDFCREEPAWVGEPGQYRIKPEPVMVPLSCEDVPPMSTIRRIGTRDWRLISYVLPGIVRCGDRGYSWEELMRDYEILRPGSSEWKPCCKEQPSA